MDKDFPYSDMIDLPHHQSANRKHMSLIDRAAQFSPFAALTGYDEVIAETGRSTEEFIELTEDVKQELDRKFMLLSAMMIEGYRPSVKVTYFVPDQSKPGGSYAYFTGDVKRIDSATRTMIFYEGEKELTGRHIDIKTIVDLESEFFKDFEPE